MSDRPLRGEVLPKVEKRVSSNPLDALSAVKTIVDAGRELVVVYQTEKTKRARLETYESTEVAKIKAAETVLNNYFREAFAERRANFSALLERLDSAVEAEDAATVQAVLRGIVEIAQSSPLSDLGDLGQIRRALDDPNQVWEL